MHINILGSNQIEICLSSGKYLQSYNSIVAKKHYGEKTLYPKWDYSKTTTKHVSMWLNTSAKEIREKIKQGEIIVETYESEL